MTPLLSIIIPTIGRSSLRATLESARHEFGQPWKRAEIIVVEDGYRPRTAAMARRYNAAFFRTEPTHSWGHAQRNFGMSVATGAYLAFMDDDDIYLPGAGDAIIQAILSTPKRTTCAYVFRMRHGKRVIWKDKEIRRGNVSTQMLVVSNLHPYLPKWGPDPSNATGSGGDYLWVDKLTGLAGRVYPRFRPEIIAQLTKHSKGKRTR